MAKITATLCSTGVKAGRPNCLKLLSTDPDSAVPQEQMLGVTIDFTWKDLRSGRILVERRGFEHTATYYPTVGEGRFVDRQQAVENLALAIVQELQADW